VFSDAQGKSDSGPEILPQPWVEAPARRDGPGGFGERLRSSGGGPLHNCICPCPAFDPRGLPAGDRW